MPRFLSLLIGGFALLLAACAPATPSEAPVVLAASSLQEAMEAAADAWAADGHARPVLSFAATSALARQVEAGAAADIFISADEKWMEEIAARKLIVPESRVDFLTNRLALVAPAKSAVKLDIAPGFELAKVLGQGRLAMADVEAVPAGRYGKQALVSLGVWESVAGHIASGENVRVALALVSRREAPLGIVYATDAKADPGVAIVGVFPENSHDPITYPMALLKASASPDAEAFRHFLLSPDGLAIFRRFGFGTPG